MKKSITLSQACDGLVRFKNAAGMSPNTLRNYRTTFAKLQAYFASHPEPSATETKNPAFDSITRDQLIDFFAWLRDEYLSEPDGAAPRGQIKLAPKTILNVHTDLSGLWTWGVEEGFVPANIVRTIDPPDPKAPVIEPLTKEEIDALLAACERSKTWKSRQITTNERPTADRDRAIILLLLDTGLRASELCGLAIKDADLTNKRIVVLGKGNKERALPISPRTAKTLWRYLTTERKDEAVNAPLFLGSDGDPLNRDALLKLLIRLGVKAGVQDCHPHRFRHTFAVNFSRHRRRNGGNAFELQMALGHTTLQMVQTYPALAQADPSTSSELALRHEGTGLDAAHRKASPVENWRL